MKDKLEYYLFLLFSYTFRITGLRFARSFATIITAFFFYILPIRKDVVQKNLKIAFPELDEGEIKKLAHNTYKNFAITLVEILYSPFITREKMSKMISFKNPEVLIEKYREGKGVVVMSAHFSNWELGAASVGELMGVPMHIIVQPLRNELVYDFMNRNRRKWRNETIELGAALRSAYKILKEKKALALLGDQRGPEDGLRVNFFGRQTAVYAGPASLSLKMGVPLVYGIAVRGKDYHYELSFQEVDRENLPELPEEKVKVLSERHFQFLEKMVRKYPDQWLWMHNIWKY
jgi:Kdo2-lipid IVA lauroyltransferase/acyltransferase